MTGHASSTLSVAGSAPFTVARTARRRTVATRSRRSWMRTSRSIRRRREPDQHDAYLYGACVRQRRFGRGLCGRAERYGCAFAFVGAHVGSFSAGRPVRSRTDWVRARSIRPRRARVTTRCRRRRRCRWWCVADADDRYGCAWPCERRQRDEELGRGEDQITPNATNEVGGAAHVHGDGVEGHGQWFCAAPGEHVDFTLTDSNGATHSAATGTCTTAVPNTNATVSARSRSRRTRRGR